jgi:hypothetical protein
MAGDFIAHPGLVAALKMQAKSLIDVHIQSPRAGAIMASHPRYLMAHLALSVYFQSGREGIRMATFLDQVEQYGIVARNTADAFLKEMEHYHFIERRDAPSDKRLRLMAPTEMTLQFAHRWFAVHLDALDALDGGDRARRLAADPGMFGQVQPKITETLLSSIALSETMPTLSIFTWIDAGSIIMDWMFAQILPPDAGNAHWRTSQRQSVMELSNLTGLSLTHLSRKLSEAMKMQSLGWIGRPGRSPIWMSEAFLNEYLGYQIAKLMMIEAALHRANHGSGKLHPKRG